MNTPTGERFTIVTHERFWDFVNHNDCVRLPIFNLSHRGYMYLDDDNVCIADMKWSRTDRDAPHVTRIRKELL